MTVIRKNRLSDYFDTTILSKTIKLGGSMKYIIDVFDLICKHKTKKIAKGWWGEVLQDYCIVHEQFLSGGTCAGCPERKEK
jgi:hypothetical protein